MERELLERLRQGNDKLEQLWDTAKKYADDPEKWQSYTDLIEAGAQKLRGLVRQLKLTSDFNDCLYGSRKYTCLEDNSRVCFICTYDPPEKCFCCNGQDFWFRQGTWICSKCHPKPSAITEVKSR